ncbi:MAG: type III-B CRISPR module-associated Cmr3 family protein [Verrucomicrobiales bacterium]
MNTILLEPTDVLFFRDGRPMGGASSGHGAAWPLPSVINHVFHAALHRAGAVFSDVHAHRHVRMLDGHFASERDRKFGSLVTAGPFPVRAQDPHGEAIEPRWYFPRPFDAGDRAAVVLRAPAQPAGVSSLPAPCCYPVVSNQPPSKDSPKPWWSREQWEAYLDEREGWKPAENDCASDGDFGDTEHAYGIEISPDSGSVVESRFYSAHYLRLRPSWRLGCFAAALDKGVAGASGDRNDLVKVLLNGRGCEIIAGGQQRVCTARLIEVSGAVPLPLPRGRSQGFTRADGKSLVKWVLLTPAVFPEIPPGISKRGTERQAHPGGWLPTWICPESGNVLLETVDAQERMRRRGLNAAGKGYDSNPNLPAKLVAAVVGKGIPVTGYALPHKEADRENGGAKPTHLAVPAGSVYYFECPDEPAAKKLAAALNWHGNGIENPNSKIQNRRSTLLGEQGFGLGVCGTWDFHKGKNSI